jgi:CRP/FNR family transcriptional regulator, cyclic AMP receptor protein
MLVTRDVGNPIYTEYAVLCTGTNRRRLDRACRFGEHASSEEATLISSEGGEPIPRAASRLLERLSRPRRPGSQALYACLLDLDDDLAQELEVRMRFSARQHATVRLLDADTGTCELATWFDAVGAGPGLLLIDGLIAVETSVAGRTVTELVGTTDLLQPPEENDDNMIGGCLTWRALRPTRFAILDSDFLDRVRAWPQITHAVYQRAERRASDLGRLRAISCQPKLEVRLVLLLWHLAARWGRVEPAGIRLSLPLTHRLLGQLVAAERPSISHALTRLSHAGIVTGSSGDWHLHGSADAHLEALIERTHRLPAVHQQQPPQRTVSQSAGHNAATAEHRTARA